MAGVINPGQRQTLLDQVMKGVAVAKEIYGIKAAYDKSEADTAAAAKDKAEKERIARGELTPGEYQDNLVKHDLREVPQGTPGALELKVQGESGPLVKFVAKPKKEDAPLGGKYETVAGPDGKPVVRWLPNGGPDVPAYVPPKDPSTINDKKDEKLRSARERAQVKLNQDLRDLDNQIASADEVMQIAELARTNPAAAGTIGLKLARAAGEKGVLSDADKKDYGGSQALQDKLARYIQRSTDGTLTQEDAEFAAKFAETMRAASERAKNAVIERNINQFTRNYGGEFGENYAIISGREWEKPSEGTAISGTGSGSKTKQNPGEAFAAPSATPKPGDEEDGYIFQGGDPADPKNWKPKGAK